MRLYCACHRIIRSTCKLRHPIPPPVFVQHAHMCDICTPVRLFHVTVRASVKITFLFRILEMNGTLRRCTQNQLKQNTRKVVDAQT